MKWFKNVTTVEELRKEYRRLLKLYHPDNENGSVEVTQEINAEYDRLFTILSKERPIMQKFTLRRWLPALHWRTFTACSMWTIRQTSRDTRCRFRMW